MEDIQVMLLLLYLPIVAKWGYLQPCCIMLSSLRNAALSGNTATKVCSFDGSLLRIV